MTTQLTPLARELMEGKNFAHVATLMPDGSPQNSVVWIDLDGNNIVFNTATKRAKPRNLRKDPRVAISIIDAENPYRASFIRGRVINITDEGGDDHIDKLAKKYMDADSYPFRNPAETRLVVTVEPEHISDMGAS